MGHGGRVTVVGLAWNDVTYGRVLFRLWRSCLAFDEVGRAHNGQCAKVWRKWSMSVQNVVHGVVWSAQYAHVHPCTR